MMDTLLGTAHNSFFLEFEPSTDATDIVVKGLFRATLSEKEFFNRGLFCRSGLVKHGVSIVGGICGITGMRC